MYSRNEQSRSNDDLFSISGILEAELPLPKSDESSFNSEPVLSAQGDAQGDDKAFVGDFFHLTNNTQTQASFESLLYPIESSTLDSHLPRQSIKVSSKNKDGESKLLKELFDEKMKYKEKVESLQQEVKQIRKENLALHAVANNHVRESYILRKQAGTTCVQHSQALQNALEETKQVKAELELITAELKAKQAQYAMLLDLYAHLQQQQQQQQQQQSMIASQPAAPQRQQGYMGPQLFSSSVQQGNQSNIQQAIVVVEEARVINDNVNSRPARHY